ncbi:hypothetical protein [Urechidicola croceus]|nr:hypothetical protein [Urechidicola croceus]
MSKILISCDEATTICDKSQYGESSFLEKVKLNFHFLFCKVCKKYTKQNSFMSKVFGNYAEHCKCSEQKRLSEIEKKKLEEEIKKRLKIN